MGLLLEDSERENPDNLGYDDDLLNTSMKEIIIWTSLQLKIYPLLKRMSKELED